MKKYFMIFAVVFIFVSAIKATDIQVNETGSGGAYTSIAAAHAAAVDGDRIIIEPKAGGAAYVESFTVSKSVQFLSNVEGDHFIVQGNISISPSAVEEIAFVGLDLIGGISTTINASTGSRTVLKLLYSIVAGNVSFNHDNYDVTIANSTLSGAITFRAGRLIGNEISYNNSDVITVVDEASGAAHASDTIQIIGNIISSTSTSSDCVYLNSADYFYQINNNYFKYTYRALYIFNWSDNIVGTNEILNNTFYRYTDYVSTNYLMYLVNQTPSGVLNIYNNLFDGYNNGTCYGMYLTNMAVGINNISYNYFDNGFDTYFTNVTNDGTNATAATFTIDTNTGEPISGLYADLGHPDLIYYDHNLTRNDLGCYGGSYSMTNYFITSDPNNNRVYLLNIPKSVYVGNPIRVEAEGFDK